MGKEIERKFLVRPRGWIAPGTGVAIRQGYLSAGEDGTVRVRIAGDRAYLTIKGPTTGMSRDEYEYEIPPADAEEMLARMCRKRTIEKTRYRVPFGGHTWEVDEFSGDNRGLVVAEVELADEKEPVEIPEWIDREVTGDPRYYNANLAEHPFSSWR